MESSSKENISFVLIGPTEPGNIGAAARAIKNMGFRRLELVAPVPYLTGEARAMACQAKDVLERAKIYRTFRSAIARKSLIVGTTRRLGSRRGMVMDVRQAARGDRGVPPTGPRGHSRRERAHGPDEPGARGVRAGADDPLRPLLPFSEPRSERHDRGL